MVVAMYVFADGLIMVLAYLFWDVGMGLLEWTGGLEKGLECGIGNVTFWQLVVVYRVVG